MLKMGTRSFFQRILFVLLFFCSLAVFADQEEYSYLGNLDTALENAKQQLGIERQRINKATKSLASLPAEKNRRLQVFITKGMSHNDLEQSALAVASTQAAIGNIQIALIDANEDISFTKNALSELEKRMQHPVFTSQIIKSNLLSRMTKQRIAIRALLDVQKKRVVDLTSLKNIVNKRLVFFKDWHVELQNTYHSQLKQRKQKRLIISEAKLQEQQQGSLQILSSLYQRLEAIAVSDPQREQKRALLEIQIFLAQERISIIRLQEFLLQFRSQVESLTIVDLKFQTVVQLHDQNDQVNKIVNELSTISALVKEKINLLKEHNAIFKDEKYRDLIAVSALQKYKKHLDQILKNNAALQTDIEALLSKTKSYREKVNAALKHQLSLRQSLPPFELKPWLNLMESVLTLPKMLWHSLQNIFTQIYFHLLGFSNWVLYLIFIVGVLLITTWVFLRKSFWKLLRVLEETSKRFSSQLLYVFLVLLRRNLGTLLILFLLLVTSAVLQIKVSPWPSIILVFLGYRIATILTRLWLVESETDVAGKDVRLYHGLKWVFAIGALLTVMTLLVHTLPVAYAVRILFNKMFMLLILILSFLLFRAWSVLPALLQRIFSVKRIYIKKVIKLISWALPITLFSNAVIGLLGYVEMAWVIGRYQAIFLAILTIYMIARGLLIDFMELNYDMAIRHLKSGWLWAQALIRPLDRVLRILLFISVIWLLVHFSGLDDSPVFIAYTTQFVNWHLGEIFGVVITPWTLAKIFIFAVVLYWFGRWSREFSFRWFYVRVKDVGLRNSLAVFTQYLLVIIGIIIGLKVFGVELKGLAFIAAAFIAAVGFGLRDVFANFISGVFLLAERPFRNGDIISLGQYEGAVVSAGIRSMKIRTWDRMEVIIPNADIFTKPFVNWTHQDDIVRSVVDVKIQRSDDAFRVQQLILDLLIEMPAVMNEPHPEVFMKNLDESLVQLEVRFFINLNTVKSRVRVRSEVLFLIWECFKENGIRPPYPQYDVHMISDQDK